MSVRLQILDCEVEVTYINQTLVCKTTNIRLCGRSILTYVNQTLVCKTWFFSSTSNICIRDIPNCISMLSSVFITGRPIFPKYAYRSNSFLINCFSTDVNVSFFKPKTVSPVSKENMFLDYKTTKIPNKEIIVNFEPIIIFLHLTAIERIHFNKELISSAKTILNS